MSETALRIWLLHVAATLFLVGLIWVIQIVHYPLFAEVGREQFAQYEQRHTRLVTWIVAPSMFVEVVTGVLLLVFRPPFVTTPGLAVSLVLLLLIWLSTAFVQIPYHETLTRGFDPDAHHRLVTTNWLRTIAWSLRGLWVLSASYAAMLR